MVALVLEHARGEALGLEADDLALKREALDDDARGALDPAVDARHREAALLLDGLPASLHDARVQENLRVGDPRSRVRPVKAICPTLH